MLYSAENTIDEYRKNLHQRLVAESNLSSRYQIHLRRMLVVFPCIAFGVLLSLQVPKGLPSSAPEGLRMAAPKQETQNVEQVRSTGAVQPVQDQKSQNGKLQIKPEAAYAEEPPIPGYQAYMQRQAHMSDTEKKPAVQRGIYLTANSTGNDEKLLWEFANLEKSKSTALVFDVKGTYVYFHASAPLAEELGLVRPAYDIPKIVQMAHERGLYAIARYIVSKDPSLAVLKPETQIQNIYTGTGIGEVWVDTSNQTTLAYNEQILRDLVTSGVDEINFDYIRYPTEYNQSAIGLTGDEKADHIEAFLRMARNIVEEQGAGTKLGLSTFAILGWNFPINFEPLGQDIARFAQFVDVISPMAYPATFAEGSYYNPKRDPVSRNYYLVYRTLQGYRELLGEDAWKLRPWIQGYYVDATDMIDQMQAVYDAGLCGFTVWNARNNYDPFYKAMTRVEIPENCL
ncbi:hypothetical protein COU76_05040 [Candidatus Peregrinibacteria bacterium CG10_big_fil_rev_8_21_14_0_10_49_10]|nr:MAG: hypothetical protein COU76_05040 [Candidatus Peregrinibacteria bacterium CG10_big_fil_rev_8_21_14_0_10_49_10]